MASSRTVPKAVLRWIRAYARRSRFQILLSLPLSAGEPPGICVMTSAPMGTLMDETAEKTFTFEFERLYYDVI